MHAVSTKLLGMALVALLPVTLASAISQARGLLDYSGGDQSISDADDALPPDLSKYETSAYETSAKYYRIHANVRLGREHRLGNGVAWRLLTDVRTGAAAPRITWMADRKSLLKANALFEAIHGGALVYYDERDVERRHDELYGWEYGQPPSFVIKPPYSVQEKIAVTYATSQLVSYVEVGFGVQMISMDLQIYGRVLDLEQGRIREIEGCGGSDDDWRNFRFGELLDVCEDAAYERFMALWAGKVRQAVATAKVRGDDLSEYCGESMKPLERDSRGIALYLTPAGLAVFNEKWFPRIAKHCAFNDISVNPIILPYRELEPFMKPGPWRDELLKQGGTTSR